METVKKKPIKRHPVLQPLSRQHHDGLLLCWKIRRGFSQKVAPERMKQYADWFWTNHLVPHFDMEENHIFPILGNEDKLVKRALAEHRRLKRLFMDSDDVERSLSLIAEELESHIRFEERELFTVIQEQASAEDYARIEYLHNALPHCENWEDEFWV